MLAKGRSFYPSKFSVFKIEQGLDKDGNFFLRTELTTRGKAISFVILFN
jgi:hypothetical protein